MPDDVSIDMVKPAPVHFGRASDKSWFYRDISQYYKDGLRALTGKLRIGAQPTVYIMFTSNAEQQKKETLLFWSGLGFGISVPLVVSGIVGFVKASGRSNGKRGRQ
jgi:hypothetical protein